MDIFEFKNKYHFLSNFYVGLKPILWNGKTYKSAEHAYQAAKFDDEKIIELIRSADTPGKAKKLGNQYTCRDDWDSIRLNVMESVLYAKFGYNVELCRLLLDTENKQLVEGNTWGDTYWGVDLDSGVGQNKLGEILMSLREYFKMLIQYDGGFINQCCMCNKIIPNGVVVCSLTCAKLTIQQEKQGS